MHTLKVWEHLHGCIIVGIVKENFVQIVHNYYYGLQFRKASDFYYILPALVLHSVLCLNRAQPSSISQQTIKMASVLQDLDEMESDSSAEDSDDEVSQRYP